MWSKNSCNCSRCSEKKSQREQTLPKRQNVARESYSNETSTSRCAIHSQETIQVERSSLPMATSPKMKAIKRNNTPLECRESFWRKNEFADKGTKSVSKKCRTINFKSTEKELYLPNTKLLKANKSKKCGAVLPFLSWKHVIKVQVAHVFSIFAVCWSFQATKFVKRR